MTATPGEIRELARSYSVDALQRIYEIMQARNCTRSSLKAAELILNRAFGLAPQAVTGAGGEGPIAISVSWKTPEIESKKEPILIEGNKVLLEEGE